MVMETTNNIIHDTKVDITASEEYTVVINENFKRNTGYFPCNHLVIYNGTDKLVLIELNDNDNERYPVPANSGRLIINKDDNIFFHSLKIIEATGANATGTIYTTLGVLPNGN